MCSMHWLALESNPDVMNKCIKNLGVPDNFGIVEMCGLDEDSLSVIPQPVLALLLLFPISEQDDEYCKTVEGRMEYQEDCPGIYFMRQTVYNACGTIALIHALANNEQNLDLDPASVLKQFLESTKDLSPEERGNALEESMEISALHEEIGQEGQTESRRQRIRRVRKRSLRRKRVPKKIKKRPASSSSSSEEEISTSDDDVLHFIALVRFGDKLVELDGRKSGPVILGHTNGENFLKDASQIIQDYMDRDPENHHFNAMAFGPLYPD